MRDGVREGESNYELNETTDCSCNLRPPQVLAHQDQRPYARRRISLEGAAKILRISTSGQSSVQSILTTWFGETKTAKLSTCARRAVSIESDSTFLEFGP